jgi:hypothetical protein
MKLRTWSDSFAKTSTRQAWCAVLLTALGCSKGPAQPVVPPNYRGVFHLGGSEIDAINVQIDDDGWHLTLCGCDSWGGWHGRVEVAATAIALLPSEGKERIRWTNGLDHDPPRMLTVRETGDGLHVVGGSVNEHWLRGRVCAVCGGSNDPHVIQLGPTGLRPCDGPLPSSDAYATVCRL